MTDADADIVREEAALKWSARKRAQKWESRALDAEARLAEAQQERDSLMADTWRAFVEAGGDPDGNLRWHCDPETAGRRLLDAVRSLREDYDACPDCVCNRSPASGHATHPATKDHK